MRVKKSLNELKDLSTNARDDRGIMAKLSIEQVEHIAKLSKLELTEEERTKYSDQLSSVLEYVGQLNEVDTEGVEPTANVTGLENVFREDAIIESSIGYKDLEKNAPKFKNGNFVVPGIFDTVEN